MVRLSFIATNMKNRDAMRMTRPAMGSAFLALFFMAMAIPAQAGVYKWVDEEGRAHYTDQPPEKGEHTQIRIQAAPSKPPVPSTPQQESVNPEQDTLENIRQRKQEETAQYNQQRDLAEKQRRERDLAYQEKAREDKKRADAQMAAVRKSRENELVAECNRNREIYCDQGVEKIKKENEMRRLEYEESKNRAINGW